MITLSIFTAIFIQLIKCDQHHPWTYDNEKEWSEQFASCKGQRQSPVSICKEDVVVDESIPPLHFTGYNTMLRSLRITNNGHTISIKKPTNSFASVSGGLLPAKYNFDSLHFHWGEKTDDGSEHTICGGGYGAEIHFVHVHDGMMLEEALKHPHGLLVLGSFYEHSDSEDNPALSPIVDEIVKVQNGGSADITGSFTLRSLMSPDLSNFFLYNGSLTTPPCSEAVNWIVFPNPTFISTDQLNKFRSAKVKSEGDDTINENVRATQPMNERKIYLRRKMKYHLPSVNSAPTAAIVPKMSFLLKFPIILSIFSVVLYLQ